jgi:hypothetical protein
VLDAVWLRHIFGKVAEQIPKIEIKHHASLLFLLYSSIG